MSKSNKKSSKKSKNTKKDPRFKLQDLLLVADASIRHKNHPDDHPRDAKVNLVKHHLSGYDNFVAYGGMEQIITDLFSIDQTIINKRDATPDDKKIEKIAFKVNFQKVSVHAPQRNDHWSLQDIEFLPNQAREKDLTYDTQISVDAKVIAKAFDKNGVLLYEKEETIINHPIARIPVMVRSKVCNTHNMGHEQLLGVNEDPYDSGGYFIINGTMWLIKNMESVKFNEPRLFRNIGHKNELSRCEFLSRPGNRFENSAQLIVRLLSNGNLTCEITIDKSINKFKEVYIPFYLLFRALGIETDKEILQYITHTDKGDISQQMLEIVSNAFKVKYVTFENTLNLRGQDDVIKFLYDRTKIHTKYNAEETDEMVSSQLSYILEIIDKNVLPHIGFDPDDRDRKAKFLGYLIHQMLLLLINPNVVKSTDRDAYDTKRVADAGTSYTKVFKKYLNVALIQPTRNKIRADMRNVSFTQVNLKNSFVTAIKEVDLTKALRQAIISGAKTVTIQRQELTYKMTSQQLQQKNQLNVLSALRDIETPGTSSAKKDVRSDEMRRVHPTFIGFICPIHSADSGEKVGMAKQMALTCTLTGIGSKEIMIEQLLSDKKYPIIHIDDVPISDIESEKKYSKVFVNGDWIGFTQHPPSFLEYWRNERRFTRINIHTGISYNDTKDHIYFDTDYGRLIAPFLIVYRDSKGVQDIKLTQKHIQLLLLKEIGIDFLVENQILEWLTPEERLNCYVAESYDKLHAERKSKLNDYTHCEIPQAMLGLPALTTPYPNHSQAPRNVFQTNQVKQTCGWFSLDHYNRMEKNTFMQYRNEMPLVQTIANKYMLPNGFNVIVAVMCYTGFNQEDSWIFNQASLDAGLFMGEHFSLERAELENDNEQFSIPNEATKETPRDYCYEKLDEKTGFIKVGSLVNKDDVLIGKIVKINKPTGPFTHIDKSIVYKYDEPGYVIRVISGRNSKDREFCKVIFGAIRPPVIGDKFSFRSGQKGVIGMTYSRGDMPCTASGITPSVIMNPHAYPTRMTINQSNETQITKYCAKRGIITDGTAFTKIDIDNYNEEMKKQGFEEWGEERLYNGMTGESINVKIFMGGAYYQRLQKFVSDEVFSSSSSVTCALTRQPVGGRARKGGLRLGEMEKDVICATGAMIFLLTKMVDDSDAYEMYVCYNCGKLPLVNIPQQIFICHTCGDNADIAMVRTKWASKVFLQEVQGMGIGVKLFLRPFTYETYPAKK